MLNIGGEIMKKGRLILKLDEIEIQVDDVKIESQKVFFMDRIVVNILQKAIDTFQFTSNMFSDDELEENIQEKIQEYSFVLNNAENRSEVIIPKELIAVSEQIKKQLKDGMKFVDLQSKEISITCTEDELKEIIEDMFELYIESNEFDLQFFDEMHYEISEEYGDYVEGIVGRCFELLGYCKTVVRIATISKEVNVFYDSELLISTKEEKENAHLEIKNEFSDAIYFDVFIGEEKRTLSVCFPFWKSGDEIVIAVEKDKESMWLVGTHKETQIYTKIKL